MSNIYKLTNPTTTSATHFESIIVVADSVTGAAKIHPSPYYRWRDHEWVDSHNSPPVDTTPDWCSYAEVEVEELGVANTDLEPGTVVMTVDNHGR